MLAAAVAFSSLLSVAPVLVIALHIAGLATGEARARAALLHDLGEWLGDAGARTLTGLIDGAREKESHAAGWASVTSAIVLAYASTRLFSQLKRALNHMWDVQARSGKGFQGKAWKQLRKRGLAFTMVIFVGVVIIGVTVLKALLASATHRFGGEGPRAAWAWQCGEALVSLGATALLFAMVFKVMPDATIAWRDAWLGGLVTSALFSVGAVLIGLYLGHKALDAMYGPAGAVVMLLLWVHYSAQVFFLGAALTGEIARRRGRTIVPDEYGIRITTTEG